METYVILLSADCNRVLACEPHKSFGAHTVSKVLLIERLVQVRHIRNNFIERADVFGTIGANTAVLTRQVAVQRVVVLEIIMKIWKIVGTHSKFAMESLPSGIALARHHETVDGTLATVGTEVNISHGAIRWGRTERRRLVFARETRKDLCLVKGCRAVTMLYLHGFTTVPGNDRSGASPALR